MKRFLIEDNNVVIISGVLKKAPAKRRAGKIQRNLEVEERSGC